MDMGFPIFSIESNFIFLSIFCDKRVSIKNQVIFLAIRLNYFSIYLKNEKINNLLNFKIASFISIFVEIYMGNR